MRGEPSMRAATSLAALATLLLFSLPQPGQAEVTTSGPPRTGMYGDPCFGTADCHFADSVCDDILKTCKCHTDVPITNYMDKCGKAASINETCTFNEQCEEVDFKTECTNGVCACKYEMVPEVMADGTINCTSYATTRNLYGDPCTVSANCHFADSVCDDMLKMCKCDTDVPISNYKDKCGKAASINETCTFVEQCKEVNLDTECKNGLCACKDEMVAEVKADGTIICTSYPQKRNLYGDPCNVSADCHYADSVCDNKRKTCKCHNDVPISNYKDKCGKAASINETCVFHQQCDEVDFNSRCKNGRCECIYGMLPEVQADGTICKPYSKRNWHGDRCSVSEDCHFDNSVCDDILKRCRCHADVPITNYFKDMCGKAASINETCIFDEQCREVTLETECKNSLCACKGEMVPEVKADGTFICVSYPQKRNLYGDPCTVSADCHYADSVCDKNRKTCKCHNDVPISNYKDKCGKTASINETCVFHQQCDEVDFNSMCKNGRCVCKYGMLPEVKTDGTICKPYPRRNWHGDRCSVSADCHFANSVCDDILKRCRCHADVPITNYFKDMCGKAASINETCIFDEQCREVTLETECKNSLCACKGEMVPEVKADGTIICTLYPQKRNLYGDPCNVSADCHYADSVCDNKRKTCKCHNDVPISNYKDKCGKIATINETCVFHQQCDTLEFNSRCKNGRCECIYGMLPEVQADGTICKPYPKRNWHGDRCSVSADCHFANSVCDDILKRCRCHADVPITNYFKDMCGKAASINETCIFDEQCREVTLETECKNSLCACRGELVPEVKADGTITCKSYPQKRNLYGDPCSVNADCHFADSVCDDILKTCKCHTDVPINNSKDMCGKAASINEMCRFDEQCEEAYFKTECKNGVCACKYKLVAEVKADGTINCTSYPQKRNLYGDPCSVKADCHFADSVCDDILKTCKCHTDVPVSIFKDMCRKSASINETCTFNEQCEKVDFKTECANGVCACKYEMVPEVMADGTINCTSCCETYQ